MGRVGARQLLDLPRLTIPMRSKVAASEALKLAPKGKADEWYVREVSIRTDIACQHFRWALGSWTLDPRRRVCIRCLRRCYNCVARRDDYRSEARKALYRAWRGIPTGSGAVAVLGVTESGWNQDEASCCNSRRWYDPFRRRMLETGKELSSKRPDGIDSAG